MRKKINIDRFVKVARDAGRPPAQPPQAKLSGLYLLALRSHVAQSQSPISSRRLTIHLDPKPDRDGRPVPVKITLT